MGGFSGPDPIGQFDNWLQPVLSSISGIANALVGQIKAIWDFLWKHVITQTLTILSRVIQNIQKVLKPITDMLRRIRDYENWLFDSYIRPMLNFIQRLRQVLLIFRLLHIHIAAALDNRLAGMEAQLISLWATTNRYLNYVLNYFNIIMNPFGVLHSGVYLASVWTAIGRVWAMLLQAPNVPTSAAQQASMAHDSHILDFQSQRANIAPSPGSPLAPDYQAHYDAIKAILVQRGY